MTIDDKNVVSIHYTLTNDAGETLDSSAGGEPLNYLHGANNLIIGLEKELHGKDVGEKFKVSVAPEEAYGDPVPELIQVVPHEMFAEVDEILPGMQFQAEGQNGEVQVVTVVKVEDEGVTLDANHPLAGQTLHFDVEIVEIRDATPEELEHGHAH